MTTAPIISRLKAHHVELAAAPAKAFRILLARLAASKAAYKSGDLKMALSYAHAAQRVLSMLLDSKLPKDIRFSGVAGYARSIAHYHASQRYQIFWYAQPEALRIVRVESGREFARLVKAA